MRIDFESPLAEALGIPGQGQEGIIAKVEALLDEGKGQEVDSALNQLAEPIRNEARAFLAVVLDLGSEK